VRLLLNSIHPRTGNHPSEVTTVGALPHNRKRKDLLGFEDENNVTIHINSRPMSAPNTCDPCYDGTGSELKFATAGPSKSALDPRHCLTRTVRSRRHEPLVGLHFSKMASHIA